MGAEKSKEIHSHVYLTYHWHLHQPLYWPTINPGTDRTQTAADSYQLKLQGQNRYPGSPHLHPENNLGEGDQGSYDPIFSKADRVQVYQWGVKDSLRTLLEQPNAGASISYSGSLMDNVEGLAQAHLFNYQMGWYNHYRKAMGFKTRSGFPRADMVGFTYHHSLAPLLPKEVFRKELQLFKEKAKTQWALSEDQFTKGFFPTEAAFSSTLIQVLVEEGYQWSIVSNGHLARTCRNYLDPDVAPWPSTGTWNTNPPNRADCLGPRIPPHQWWSGSLDGRGAKVPAPYAYQAHWVEYTNPETEKTYRLIAVPMDEVLSYMNGFSTMSTGIIDEKIAPFSDLDHPSLILMAHDGDNAWGGGHSYYHESVSSLVNEAASKGYQPTTIQQFLTDHPVPTQDVVHIEDGGWINPEGDWGDPQFVKWLYPPARSPLDPQFRQEDPRTYVDIENGFSSSWRSWAVIMAGANLMETADQLARTRYPSQMVGVEKAWQLFLAGLDSGFVYYGSSLDDEVKQSLAINSAYPYIQDLVLLGKEGGSDGGGAAEDKTPPTVLRPQRWPWNPGGVGWGQTTGYRGVGLNGNPPYSSDFYIWTLAYDLTGISEIQVMVRRHLEPTWSRGELLSPDSQTYAGGPAVTPWVSYPMQQRKIDPLFRGSPPDPKLNYFIQPVVIADHYWAKISGYGNVFLDYYIEARDGQGNFSRSDIFHVWVEGT